MEEAPMSGGICPCYWIVRTSGSVSVTEVLDVAVTTICDEVDLEEEVVAQPVNMLVPIALNANSNSNCKRQRFLKPPSHSTTASIVPANNGLGSRCSSAVVAGTVIVSVVVALARANVVTVGGLKAHVAPTGRNPEQLNAIEPLNAAFAVIVRMIDPLPPAGTVMVGSGDVIVKAGGGRLMT